MFVIKKSSRLDEANEKALTPVCTVRVQKIFALLHAQAVQAVQAAAKKGVLIENTAADGNDAKTAVFHSAGEHMIVARSQKEGEKIGRKEAVDGIREYVKVFCGEDVSKGLKDDEFFALPEGGESGEGSNGEDSGEEGGEGEDEPLDESLLSFRMFLSESAGIRVIAEADEEGEDADDSDFGDEAGENDDEDEMGDEDDRDSAGAEDDGEDAGDSDEGDEGGGTESGEDDGEDSEEEGDAKKDGFYVLYGLKIKGLKETTVQDALKQWGSNFLKGFGVKFGSSWGGMGSEVHTVGKLMKNFSKVFGAISDPEGLEREVKDKLEKKFPQLSIPEVEFRDKKTLVADLEKTHRAGFDGKAKQKINSADYSLYIHVEKDDPKKPFLNRKIIANIVTLSISGLFKKFKNKVGADDVIYLQGSRLDKTGHDSEYRDTVIPTPDQLDDIIQANTSHLNKIWLRFDALFDRIVKNKKLENDEQAKSFKDLWTKFKKDHKESSKNVLDVGEYENFLDDYAKAYSARQTNEDLNFDVFKMFDVLFENGSVSKDVVAELNSLEPLCAVYEEDGSRDDDADGADDEDGEDIVANKDKGDASALDKNDGGVQPESGDDLYIIPMPGVKYDDTDDDGFTKTM